MLLQSQTKQQTEEKPLTVLEEVQLNADARLLTEAVERVFYSHSGRTSKCTAKAVEHNMPCFTLLGDDPAFAATVLFWASLQEKHNMVHADKVAAARELAADIQLLWEHGVYGKKGEISVPLETFQQLLEIEEKGAANVHT